jgi:hypothetical protein
VIKELQCLKDGRVEDGLENLVQHSDGMKETGETEKQKLKYRRKYLLMGRNWCGKILRKQEALGHVAPGAIFGWAVIERILF